MSKRENLKCLFCDKTVEWEPYLWKDNDALMGLGWRAFTVWHRTLWSYTASFSTRHACPEHSGFLRDAEEAEKKEREEHLKSLEKNP